MRPLLFPSLGRKEERRRIPLMNVAKEAKPRITVILYDEAGCSMETVGPRVTLYIIRTTAAGGPPGTGGFSS